MCTELVVAFYASMQQQLAEAQKGREEREKDMQDAHMAASPEVLVLRLHYITLAALWASVRGQDHPVSTAHA